MPQLDPNTFIYQYAAIISVFMVIYFLLSYIVLPLILRSIIIRDRLIQLSTNITEVLPLLPPALQRSLILKTSVYLSLITSLFFKRVSRFIRPLFIKHASCFRTTVGYSKLQKIIYAPALNFAILDYLILFVISEDSEITDSND